MVSRVRPAGDQLFLPVASDCLSSGVELGERRVRRIGSAITVRVINSRHVNAGSRHIRNIDFHIAEVMIDARSPCTDVAVAEISGDAWDSEQLHLMSGRERSQIILKSRQIDDGIRWNILRSAGRENWLSLDVV